MEGLGGQTLEVCFHRPAPLVLHAPALPPTCWVRTSLLLPLAVHLTLPLSWLYLSVRLTLLLSSPLSLRINQVMTSGPAAHPGCLSIFSTLCAAPHPLSLVCMYILILRCSLTLSRCAHARTHTHTHTPDLTLTSRALGKYYIMTASFI